MMKKMMRMGTTMVLRRRWMRMMKIRVIKMGTRMMMMTMLTQSVFSCASREAWGGWSSKLRPDPAAAA